MSLEPNNPAAVAIAAPLKPLQISSHSSPTHRLLRSSQLGHVAGGSILQKVCRPNFSHI